MLVALVVVELEVEVQELKALQEQQPLVQPTLEAVEVEPVEDHQELHVEQQVVQELL